MTVRNLCYESLIRVLNWQIVLEASLRKRISAIFGDGSESERREEIAKGVLPERIQKPDEAPEVVRLLMVTAEMIAAIEAYIAVSPRPYDEMHPRGLTNLFQLVLMKVSSTKGRAALAYMDRVRVIYRAA
jgi:hypothetical protein